MTQRKDFKPRFEDVSIYDFANSSLSGRKGRLSKAVVTPIAEVQRLTKSRHGLRWDQHLDDREAVGDDEIKKDVFGTNVHQHDDPCRPYLILPMDIWFSIGEHIQPEDVKVFASICKSSQKVTNSARFWFGMYKKFYNSSHRKVLPERLKPERMKTLQGLRACVIRSLFFIYPPFIERMKPATRNECDLQPVYRRKCINTWYTTNGKNWTYWFKLKRINPRAGRYSSLSSSSNTKLLQIEQDIGANEEIDSKVLQVSSSSYLPLPAVHGLTLTKALITVSHNMMSEKLSLTFGNEYLVFDPASSIQVLDWWHSQYPNSNNNLVKKRNGFSFHSKDASSSQSGTLIDHWYNVKQ